MDQPQVSTVQQIRVSVVLKVVTENSSDDDTASKRYKRAARYSQQQGSHFLSWLDRHHINYANVVQMDTFRTVFLDVDADKAVYLSHAPQVLEVHMDRNFKMDPLNPVD